MAYQGAMLLAEAPSLAFLMIIAADPESGGFHLELLNILFKFLGDSQFFLVIGALEDVCLLIEVSVETA